MLCVHLVGIVKHKLIKMHGVRNLKNCHEKYLRCCINRNTIVQIYYIGPAFTAATCFGCLHQPLSGTIPIYVHTEVSESSPAARFTKI